MRFGAAAVARLRGSVDAAMRDLWWPFTQHTGLQRERVSVVDARCGEDLAVFQEPGASLMGSQEEGSRPGPKIKRQYDACASWWTQASSCSKLCTFICGPQICRMMAQGRPSWLTLVCPGEGGGGGGGRRQIVFIASLYFCCCGSYFLKQSLIFNSKL